MNNPDEREIEERIQANTGLIYAVLKQHFYRRQHDEDYWQAGRIGLWNAARTYDPDTGNAFSTYAYTCIRNAIESHRKHEAREKQAPAEPDWPMEGPISPEGGPTLGDAIAAPNWEDKLLDHLAAEETVRRVEQRDPRLGYILRQYMGGGAYQEIGDKLGLTRERVRQLCRSARKYIQKE